MSIALLLRRAMPGSRASISAHIERGERIADAIRERFNVGDPHQWQAKHVRWVLDRWAQPFSISTRYDYWRTARALAAVLGHWPDWAPHLQGSWCRKGTGGRPTKLAMSGKKSLRMVG
jgi:hypothetical protein